MGSAPGQGFRRTKCVFCGKETTYRKTLQIKDQPVGKRICRTQPCKKENENATN